MPRIIVSSRYLKPGTTGKRGGLVRYIATRESVVMYSPQEHGVPVTKSQTELVTKLLEMFPSELSSHEYADYKSSPTKENASELITEILERNADRLTDREMLVKYISERPGVEKIGKHGLFSADKGEVELNEAKAIVSNHDGNEVERMKIEFSMYDDYTMTLGEGSKPFDIDYDTFSDVITPLLTENVLNSILKIMEKANVSPENIDAVILAGGSSGLRPFAEIILSLFGDEKIFFDDENNKYQWLVAKGAAITSAINCDFRLSDDICILLSDGDTYPILRKDVNKVGDQSEPISFSLTSDSYDAHFIITDSTGKNRYDTISVKAKGFVDEKFDLSVEIGKDQIARVVIKNDYIGNGYREKREINKLRFYYDLNDIEE